MNDSPQEILSSEPRCRVLTALKHRNPPIQFTTLVDPTGTEEVQSQKVALAHNHLPKLDDVGFINWDRNQRLVEKGQRFDEIRPYLNPKDANDSGFGLAVLP